MEGFIVFEYASRYPEARAWLADQVSKGNIKYDYHVVRPDQGKEDGLDGCVPALQGIFEGMNFGKWYVYLVSSCSPLVPRRYRSVGCEARRDLIMAWGPGLMGSVVRVSQEKSTAKL